MKTSTLRQLIASLADTQHVHLTSALLETDSARQSRERHRAYRIGVILDAIRFELSARGSADRRSKGIACRADHYIEHLLEDFFETQQLGGIRKPSVSRRRGPKPNRMTAT